MMNLEVISVIVNHGMARKVIKYAKQNEVTGATIFYGMGTSNNSVLKFFELTDIRKEIVLMLVDASIVHTIMDKIDKKFKLYKPHHGIAFSIPVAQVLGASMFEKDYNTGGVNKSMYDAIYTIVDKGNAELVIEAATAAGSKGGTIINARGSGIHETSKVFNMEIVPEKEIVLILSEHDVTENIANAIREQLKIDEPGNGIIFIQPVNKTYGLV